MSNSTILKSQSTSGGSTNRGILFFRENRSCRHRLPKHTPTVLIAGTITDRLSTQSAGGIPGPAETGSEAQRAAESTIRLFAYCSLAGPLLGTAAGHSPGIFVSTQTVAVATVYLTWPWLTRGHTGPTNPSFVTFLPEKDFEAEQTSSYSTMVTVISMRSRGLSRSSRGRFTILSATPMPFVTSPNTEYLRSRNRESSTTMKN